VWLRDGPVGPTRGDPRAGSAHPASQAEPDRRESGRALAAPDGAENWNQKQTWPEPSKVQASFNASFTSLNASLTVFAFQNETDQSLSAS
jgi:hypothetical protein